MKKKLLHVLFILASAALLFGEGVPEILLIGNSYFGYNNQPAMLKSMCDSAGQPVNVNYYLKNGTSLLDHTRDDKALAKIAERAWDYVVVIGGSRGVAYPRDFPEIQTYLSILTLRNKTHEANESGRLIYVMPWAFEDGMLWVNNWTDDYTAMQQKIDDNALRWAQHNDYTVAPAGRAWQSVLDSMDFPLHYLHLPDWNHPSSKGSYLLCCVLYCTLFQDSCTTNTYIGELPNAEAEWYQDLASKMVLDSPELWNLPSLETATLFNVSTFQRFNLSCYPNPFNASVVVSMKYGIGSHTRVNVYDVSGRLIKTLHDGYLDTGDHEFRWDASDVSAGVYIVSVQHGDEIQTQKVVYLP
ncbi:MAG: T9SS type A sorting domain-containing protein [Candidatus Marinimicrobia bacterium]|nr:T9SS type A sorting domain-containing protein [Candidatus Neomarinimicrobiota bacterium]